MSLLLKQQLCGRPTISLKIGNNYFEINFDNESN